jgi:ABC-type ATPase with predicted acetyltransferase domain
MSDEKLLIDVRFNTRVQRSPRILEVAEAFGIGLDDKEFVVFDNLELTIRQGDVIYITGQSGAGKSVLLREIGRQMKERGKSVVNLDNIEFENKPIIEQLGKDTNDAIRLLNLAGLNDAYIWVRLPSELSDGQRYRLRVAKAIEQKPDVWLADEFMAVLDRTTAKIIAYAIQKTARRSGATLAIATTHRDLINDLGPDLYIEKRFREKLLLERIEEAGRLVAERIVTRDELNDLLLKGL